MRIIGNREDGNGSIYDVIGFRFYNGHINCTLDTGTLIVIHRPEGAITVTEYENLLREMIAKDVLDLRTTNLQLKVESKQIDAYVTNLPNIPIYTNVRGDDGVGVWVTNR
jgi:hypothetical protein